MSHPGTNSAVVSVFTNLFESQISANITSGIFYAATVLARCISICPTELKKIVGLVSQIGVRSVDLRQREAQCTT